MEKDTKDNTTQDVLDVKYMDPTYVPYGVTSFQQLDDATESIWMAEEAAEVTQQFAQIANNIIHDDTVEDKPGLITRLVDEMGSRIKAMWQTDDRIDDEEAQAEADQMDDEEKDFSFKSSSIEVFKGADGGYWLLGRMTNHWIDREDEIIASKGHEWFANFVNKYPQFAPELWVWHVPESKMSHKAVWVDYADGQLTCLWPLEPEEAEGMQRFAKDYEPGMSHGFVALERDGNTIWKYVSIEGSVLPNDMAANDAAGFAILHGKDKKMAFTEDRRKVLASILGEDRVAAIEAENEKSASVLNADRQHKSVDEETGPEDNAGQDEPKPEPQAAAPAPVQAPSSDFESNLVQALQAMETRIMDAVQSKMAEMEENSELLAQQVVHLLGDHDEEVAAKAVGMTPATLSEFIQGPSILESEGAQLDGRSSLAKSGPETDTVSGDGTDLFTYLQQLSETARQNSA